MEPRAIEELALQALEFMVVDWSNKRRLANVSEETLAALGEIVGPDEVDYRRKLQADLGPANEELLKQPCPDDAHPAIWELYRLKATGAPAKILEEGLLLAHHYFCFDVATLYEIFVDGDPDA